MRIIISSIIFINIFFIGCANKNLGNLYYKNKNYEKAYEEYYAFAKRGFPDSAYKISKLIYLNKVKKPANIERKYGLLAYKNGYKDAALFIADSYFRERNYKKALDWYNKISFDKYREDDFKNYIISIEALPTFKLQKQYLDKLDKFAKSKQNPKLLTNLGKFYLKQSPFYNQNKAINYLQKAYKLDYYPAGVILGIYLIKSDTNKTKGYNILKKLTYTDANAAFYIGNYLYDEMINTEQSLNKNCISTTFSTPKQFFVKKLTIYKYNNLFTTNNIVNAYKISYKLGNEKALYKLIRLDIKDNTFQLNKKHTYSGFDLNNTITYLKSQKDNEAKLILASIYKKYICSTNQCLKAKNIYTWYTNINKPQAYWLLYQYDKQFNNKINYSYLNYLVKIKFVPAIIENAYQQIILNKNIPTNKKTLKYYANQNNILALNYLGSLYSKNIFTPKENSFNYYKKACELETKPFYIPSEDLKIANFYNTHNETEKYITINYYYAQMNNDKAQLNIVQLYKTKCKYNKMLMWLNKLKNKGNQEGIRLYYSNILERYIPGDYKKAIDYFLNHNDLYSYLVLGNIYANGYYVDFKPKKAIEYYQKALKEGYNPVLYSLINLYKKININNKYTNKIIELYKEAIKANLKDARVNLARFYLSINKKQLALQTLKEIPNYNTNPKAIYLTYLITGKKIHTNGDDTNYGYLLLLKAKNIQNTNPKKALYYTFRAMLCNTPKTPRLSYILMKKINNSRIIKNIYQQAKQAPKCTNK